MTKVIKMQKDKFKDVIQRQNEPEKPKTLGEPVETIAWRDHAMQEIEYYTIIESVNVKDPAKKQAYVYRPNPGMIFKLIIRYINTDLICPEIATIDTAKNVIANMFPAGTVSFIHFKDSQIKKE